MGHRVVVEVVQEDGRTLEVTPAGGVRTTGPLLPRGELLDVGGQEYVVLAIRQSLCGWPGLDEWSAVTTYLVDEAIVAVEGAAGLVRRFDDVVEHEEFGAEGEAA